MILQFGLACVYKFEHNLALASTAEPVQDKAMLQPQIFEKILSHFREDVLSSGKDIGRRRAASWV